MRDASPGIDPVAALSDWKQQATSAETSDWTRYKCSLATPLYGGGVRAGEVDETMPIRASGLRGQLRFWWRIACGPFASSETMFARESAIWGGISSTKPMASKVMVRVESVKGLTVKPAFNYGDPDASGRYRTSPKDEPWISPYAVFPARGKLTQGNTVIEEPPHKLAQSGLTFFLKIGLHPDLTNEQREEVQTALRWWASFGGVGARTRRGLGAVQIRDLEPVSTEEVAAKGGQLGLRAAERTVAQDAGRAWMISVGRLSNFRQGEGIGRNPRKTDSNTPGRSRWPEPDMIRRQTRCHAPEHRPEHPVQGAYPRAAFGLPIVFHFKDENKGEPQQQLLVPEGADRDRMASPLILRPYWNGQCWQPAALLLPDWEQALDVVAEFSPGTDHRAWPKDANARAKLAAQIKPMKDRGTDPLSAFMAYFQED